MLRIAINGFGRVGRAVMRLALDDSGIEVVAINDRFEADQLGYLLRYDSIHGTLEREVTSRGNLLVVDGREIPVYRRREPLLLPWRRRAVDVVIEATGAFRGKRRALRHWIAGARHIVITANPDAGGGVPILVRGVNENAYRGETVVSAGSCSVNAAGALLRILHEEFRIRCGMMTAIHAYTQDQRILDSGHGRDWRRGRAASLNLVPCKSDAARVLAALLPELEGRLAGGGVRVPTADGSLMNIVCEFESSVEAEEINDCVRDQAVGALSGVLAYSEDPLVSRDVLNDTHSAVFDAQLTSTGPGDLTRIACWFDHEYGYAAQVLEVAKLVAGAPPAVKP